MRPIWPRATLVRVAVLFLAATAATPAWAAAPSPAPTHAEHPLAGAPVRRPISLTDQLAHVSAGLPPSTQAAPRSAANAVTVAPFLTRPYLHQHSVNSVFDHCNPDYTVDGRICEFDGIVAVQSNGVDPTFTRGYAITAGGTNYLYYDGHNGWDFGLNYENLLAAADGTVGIAGQDPNNGGFGLNVTIDHGNGFTTRYAHMSKIAVNPGQHVARGQGIGISGNTGASTGPHLHFGLYRTNPWTAIDPWGWTGSQADPWPADAGNMWIGGNPQDPAAGTPTGVTVTLAGQAATINWTAPAPNPSNPVTGYAVTSNPDGMTTTVAAGARTATVTGLAYSTAYTFTVVASASAGTGGPSAPTAPVTTGRAPYTGLYTLDGYGGVHGAESPALPTSGSWQGWDIARGMALKGDNTGGYVVDGWGGIHSVGNANANVSGGQYWPGWDIVRDIAVLRDGSGGYELDGWGHLHPFATGSHTPPPAPSVSAFWQGWDIARKVTLLPDGSGGYVLDGWGGVHPFSTGSSAMPPYVQTSAYWSGWDIARGITMIPGETGSGYVLDGWGGLHFFGPQGAPQQPSPSGAYWSGWDIARGVIAAPNSSLAAPSGWVLDGYGGVHPYGMAGTPRVSAYWGSNNIGHAVSAN